MTWREVCRQCGKPAEKGRAWCKKHLRLVQLGLPTDAETIPKAGEGHAETSGQFPYWPGMRRDPT